MILKLLIHLTTLLILEILILRSFYNYLKKEEPDRYFTLSEMSRGKTPIQFFFQYAVFRFFPITIVCILNYKILTPVVELNIGTVLDFNIVVALVEVFFTNLKGYRKYQGLGLSYQHLFFAFLVCLSPFLAALFFQYFSHFLPTTQGVIDNIWTAVIIYGIFSFFGFMSKSEYHEQGTDFSLFTKKTLEIKIKKYSNFIESESLKYNANIALVKAIAIYESIQRPRVFRFLERIFVLITKIPTTQGIMQYKSKNIITDEESITLSIKDYFKDTQLKKIDYFVDFFQLISAYNFSASYSQDVYYIYSTLLKKD